MKTAFQIWQEDLEIRLAWHLLDHPEKEQKLLPAAKRIPIIEVRDVGGFWEVLVDGRMVFGSGGDDAQRKATKKAADILSEFM